MSCSAIFVYLSITYEETFFSENIFDNKLLNYKLLKNKQKQNSNNSIQPLPNLESFAISECIYLEVIQGNDVFMFQFLEKVEQRQ